MAADFTQATSLEIAGVAMVGCVGPGRPHQLAQPRSVFLSIGTEDAFGQPTQSEWNSMPAIVKREWYGQETLPTLEEDVAGWAQLDQCKGRNRTSTAQIASMVRGYVDSRLVAAPTVNCVAGCKQQCTLCGIWNAVS
jgi:hypothetical protein